MLLSSIDWVIIAGFFALNLLVGFWVFRRAGESSKEYFLSGANMPWWLLGFSMVATTFSADTPNLVTDIVRQNGISGNWVWWIFLLTGMLTVFVYARLWRRSNILTDLEFYEIRYSGKSAAFLRGFRAIYLGVFFNVLVMASVSLALIKITSVMFGWSPVKALLIVSSITVLYSALGGLRSVIYTDFIQFIVAMAGAIFAAKYTLSLPEVGGIQSILQNAQLADKLNFLPDFSDPNILWTLVILPLAVQWWSVWYPGAEPGGGGYIAQRMLSAKNENHATGAVLFFNVAHYALRPWPWIIVALSSLLVFPDLDSIARTFPHISEKIIAHDLAYPAMLTLLPAGLLGVVVASLLSAFMSTISTHLNWGASYFVHDFYRRFVNPNASEQTCVRIGRLSTLVLMLLSALLALALENALQAFNILLNIGAGTGLIFILRWFWWRINSYSEITAMVVSFVLAIYFQLIHSKIGFDAISNNLQLPLGVAITTIAWLLVTFLTKPSDESVLIKFFTMVKPAGPGWKPIRAKIDAPAQGNSELTAGIAAMFFAVISVYFSLFGTGMIIFGRSPLGMLLLAIAGLSAAAVWYFWKNHIKV